MSATINTPKQNVIQNAKNAASGKDVCDPKAKCQPCKRTDLQLLIVVPSVIGKENAKALSGAGYAWAPSFDLEFGAIKREATLPVARIMRAGYIYVHYIQRKCWDVWQVMANGLTRKIMHQVSVAQYENMHDGFANAPEPRVCSQGAANLPAHLISIHGAQTTDKAWLACTDTLWSPVVLKRFTENPDVELTGQQQKSVKKKLRDLRGREINPQGIVQGKFPITGFLPLNKAALEHNVADFVAKVDNEFKKAFELSDLPLDDKRIGKAETFEETVRNMERASSPAGNRDLFLNKTIILMLPDPLGVAKQHNHLRLAEAEAKRLWTIGSEGKQQKADAERPWKLRSSLHAEMIEQWEASKDAARIKNEVNHELHKNLAPVTEEEYDRQLAAGRYPAGTGWSPIYMLDGGLHGKPILDAQKKPVEQTVASRYIPGGKTRLGKLVLPDTMVQQAADKKGAATAVGFRDRLRGRLDWKLLSEFRAGFEAESHRWDESIAQYDRDYLTWCESAQLAAFFIYDFSKVNLAKIDPKLGTTKQQVLDWANKVIATEKVVGGGAITLDSTKALARFYKFSPDDPRNWIDAAMYEPFDFVKKVVMDRDNRNEAKENIGEIIELGKEVYEAIEKTRERLHLEEALRSILAARAQMSNLIASAIDKKMAKALGLEQISLEQARQVVRLHLKIEMLSEELINLTWAQRVNQKYVFNMKIPAGVAVDEVREAIQLRVLPMKFEPKNDTTRQERRYTGRQFKNVSGRINDEIHFPVLLDKSLIEKLQREAVASGKRMIEIVPDGALGYSSGPIKVPEEIARRLIREQTITVRQAINDSEGRTIGAAGVVHVIGLWFAARKIIESQGVDQADGVLSVISSIMGLVETGGLYKLHVWTMRVDGARTITVEAARSMSRLRLGTGILGGAASILTGTVAFLKQRDAENAGDRQTAYAYKMASRLYIGSGLLGMIGTTATYQAFTSTGFVVANIGVRGTALLGAYATGAGVVLTLAAFGYMLYTINTQYQMTDMFLDRSYWGKGERVEGKFGDVSRDQLTQIRNDKSLSAQARASNLDRLIRRGLEAEMNAFCGLNVGLKTEIRWHNNWFSADAVAFKIESGEWPPGRMVDIKIEIFADRTSAGKVVVDEKKSVLKGERNDEGFLELEKSHTFDGDSHKAYSHARATFVVYDDANGVNHPITRDSLFVRRST